jgi:hypothetical protein
MRTITFSKNHLFLKNRSLFKNKTQPVDFVDEIPAPEPEPQTQPEPEPVLIPPKLRRTRRIKGGELLHKLDFFDKTPLQMANSKSKKKKEDLDFITFTI